MEKREKLSVDRVLFLCSVETERSERGLMYVFAQYTRCTDSNDRSDEMMKYLWRRQSTSGRVDHLQGGINGGRNCKEKQVRDYFKAQPFPNV